jgi:acyl carrier protein
MKESERSLRRTLVALIHQAGILGLRDDDLQEAFISGATNPTLPDIGTDSLSEMELCIAIEEELGVAIAPAELGKLITLEALLERVDRLQR